MYDIDSWTATAPLYVIRELEEIRDEADEWRITWNDGESETATLAWVVYKARRDSDVTAIEPVQAASDQPESASVVDADD